MVGLDIEYAGSGKAPLSVWRHKYVKEGESLLLTLIRGKEEEFSATLLSIESQMLTFRSFLGTMIASFLKSRGCDCDSQILRIQRSQKILAVRSLFPK
jgi:hypothetical protein